MTSKRGLAVVTGASAGIGRATVQRLVAEGFEVMAGARRTDRLEDLAAETGCGIRQLDVTDAASVEAFAAGLDSVNLLVNNAGLASGIGPIAEMQDDRAELMYQTNVLGLLRVTRALLPALEASGSGHVVNIGSTAGRDAYPGGGGYIATKFAVKALTRTLRLELLGKPIRVSEVAPGLVETEFSVVRFDGDVEKAKKPYEGLEPLVAEDIADCIAWVATRPPHVNVDEVVVRPLAQATSTAIHRGPIPSEEG